MASVYLKMRDGTDRRFPHEGRAGGSYTKTVRYEPGFVVIVDEYYQETAIPVDLVAEVRVEPERW